MRPSVENKQLELYPLTVPDTAPAKTPAIKIDDCLLEELMVVPPDGPDGGQNTFDNLIAKWPNLSIRSSAMIPHTDDQLSSAGHCSPTNFKELLS